MWLSCPEGLKFHHHLLDEQEEGVLALEVKDSTTLYASFQGGKIRVFDLATFTMLRTLSAGSEDVLSLTRAGDSCISTCADGSLQVWNKAFSLESSRLIHDGIALSSSASCDGQFIYTGGNDGLLKVWYHNSSQKAAAMQSEALQGERFLYLGGWEAEPTCRPPLHASCGIHQV
jgi:di- and tripeptidase